MSEKVLNIIYGMMIYKFSQSEFFKGLQCTDENGKTKDIVGEDLYENLISLLEKDAICICRKENGALTILPHIDDEPMPDNITPSIDLEKLKGKYLLCAYLQNMMEKEEEK